MRGLVLLIALAGCDQLLGLSPVSAIDGGPSVPTFVQAAYIHAGAGTMQPTQVDLPVALVGPASLCIATIGIGIDSPGPTPSVESASYAGQPMTVLLVVQGADSDPETLTEQWWLAAPELTSGDLVITLQQPGQSMHVSAMLFANVNTDQPVHDKQMASGRDGESTLVVASDPGELVESVTGQGTRIVGPGGASTSAFVDNASGGTSLDNAWGSYTQAMDTSTTVAWSYAASDLFQTVAASLSPPATN